MSILLEPSNLQTITKGIAEINLKLDTSSEFNNEVITNGDNLIANATDIQFSRLQTGFARNTVLADQTDATTTERIIGEGVPISSNELSRPTSLRTLSFASTDSNDTIAGTGCRTIIVIGLDSNGLEQTEFLNLNGQTEVDTVLQYTRINEFFVTASGTTNSNVGTIFCSDDTDTFASGIPQNRIYDIMDAGHSLSKTGNYSFGFPSTTTLVLKRIVINTDATEAKPVIIRLYRTFKELDSNGNTEILIGIFYLANFFSEDFSVDRFLRGDDEVRVTAQTNVGTVKVSVKLMFMIKDI